MPNLPDLLTQLNFVRQEAFLLGLLLTAAVILVVRDWRLLILALLTQYILVGWTLSRLIRPDVAAVKVMIGSFICLVLFLSVRQVRVAFSPTTALDLAPPTQHNKFVNWWMNFSTALGPLIFGRNRHRGLAATGFVFRCFAALLMMFVAFLLGQTLSLPGLAIDVAIAVFWLLLAGLTLLILNEDPLKVGLGLFTLFTGFDLFYATLETSFLMAGLWGAVNLLIALVIGYLLVVKGATPEEEW